MSEILLQLHSLVPYLFLVLILVTIIMTGMAMNSGNFNSRTMSLARVVMILAHIQFILGILLLVFGDRAKGAFTLGMGEIMKSPELRLSFVEHPSMMIIGVALITIGFARSKRSSNGKSKAKNILVFYTIGLLIVLSRIPYGLWLNA